MSDPYSFDPEPRQQSTQPSSQRRPLRTLLWVLLAAGVSVNLVSNIVMGGDQTPVGLASGVVGVAAIAGLIALAIAGRRT